MAVKEEFRQFEMEVGEIVEEMRSFTHEGSVATYIPELRHADPGTLGCALYTKNGTCVSFGDGEETFTLQSVSKVVALALAVMDSGEDQVFDKVGMEPTGGPFYSIARLALMNSSKPLNPMINAGALTVTSMIGGRTEAEKVERLLRFIRELTGNDALTYDSAVAASEFRTADYNRALAYLLKGEGVIDSDIGIEPLLDVYTKQCALSMSCCDLARIVFIFGHEGRSPETGEQIVPAPVARMVKTFMVTCGMYNESGELAIRAGIPAKSGVSGAILGSVPDGMGIGIYSPALNEKGNSRAGVELLKRLSRHFQLSIF
ncbi:glutaminase A [Salicibibacter kimchii]|uniref:Glutaminase n=1 Tax=Salicibibacter kimchii TaxID=2099786 RepID=A0A345BX30_9BACI|nr:glutaminase A [Salicibibacter kimchii]AXF55511.1 glutaminase A [Salicibibacter kimchii]